jgi:predicted RNA-binding protein associated with RNAse of E/G family
MIPRDRVVGEVVFDFIRPPDRRVTFRSFLLSATDEVIVTAHESAPSKPVEYRGQVVLDHGYWGVWFVFKDRPFDVARVYRPDGTWTGYYVDVLEPVQWDGSDANTLQPIVDLFLDIWVAPDGGHVVLDEDEFQEAANLRLLTDLQVEHARRVLGQLVAAIETGAFPPATVRAFRL